MTLNNEHYSFHIFSRGINAFIKVVICWLSSRILLSCPLYTERTRPRRPWRVWTWKPGRPWSVWTWKAISYHTSKKRKSLQIQYFSLKYAEKYFLKYEEKYIFSGMQRNIFSLVCREITDTRAADFPPAGQTHILHCAESRCCIESADSFCRYSVSKPCQRVWFSSGEHFLHLNVKHPSMYTKWTFQAFYYHAYVCHTVVPSARVQIHRVTFHSCI